MYWYGSGMGTWGYVLMTISVVVFWAVVIVGIAALVRYFGRGSTPTVPPSSPTPEQILAGRFALGEIDAGEYRDRLDALRANGHAAGDPVPKS